MLNKPSFSARVLTELPFFRVNNFRFQAEGSFQKIYPFAAHVRKTNPRADREDCGISIEKNRITRRGVQFIRPPSRTVLSSFRGPGLIIRHSHLEQRLLYLTPGLDLLIGQGVRTMSGTDPDTPTTTNLTVHQFIDSRREGEYFFSPSLKGLRETLATA